jgi:hypothetical protein
VGGAPAALCLTPHFSLRAIALAEFSFDSSHYLNHHSNILTIIGVSAAKPASTRGGTADKTKKTGVRYGAF